MPAVLRALTDGGHSVTAFTPFADGGHGGRENYTEVDVSGEFPRRLDADLAAMVGRYGDAITAIDAVARLARPYCDAIRRNGRLREILRRGPDADFDAILVEPLWLDCMSRLAAELDVPLLYAVPYALPTFLERSFLGTVPSPAAVSHVMARHASAPKTFVQRFANAAVLAYGALVLGYHDLWAR